MTKKYKVGDKVIPINKSVYSSLDQSNMWKRAREKGQNFIYINNVAPDVGDYRCNVELTEFNGDFFLESDLIPYVPYVEENKKIEVKGDSNMKDLLGVLVEDLTKEEAQRIYDYLAGNDIETELITTKVENSDKGYHYEYFVKFLIPEGE